MKTTIYALCDTRYYDTVIRYIGKTRARLKKRLKAHIWESKKNQTRHRTKWIASLLKDNCNPEIIVLEVVEGDGNAEEIKYIREFTKKGFNLVNGTMGGDGGGGRPCSEETKEKLRRIFALKEAAKTPKPPKRKYSKRAAPRPFLSKEEISRKISERNKNRSKEIKDKISKSLQKSHCKYGHEMAGDNLSFRIRNGRVTRDCKACKIIR
jgi:hypothetical protein